MQRQIKRWTALGISAVALLGISAAIAADRDEGAAREYVYCGRIVAAMESASEAMGRADGARAFRSMRSFFVTAAVLRSDGEFIKLEVQSSSQRFKARFPGQDVSSENKELEAEVGRCIGLFTTEVKPLLGLK
jgi:hypothetical protein